MLYLVAMETIESGLLPPQQQAQFFEQVIIPSHEALVKLLAEKKILAGGIFAGARAGVAIVEAASNEELGRLLVSLPFWGVVKVDVTPLESIEFRLVLVRQMLEQLKKAL